MCYDGVAMDDIPSASYDSRRQCGFKHVSLRSNPPLEFAPCADVAICSCLRTPKPGLGVIYSSYWSTANYDLYEADQSIPNDYFASAFSGSQSDEFLESLQSATKNPFGEPAIGFALFPWVCGTDPEDDKALFNGDGAPGVKCYYVSRENAMPTDPTTQHANNTCRQLNIILTRALSHRRITRWGILKCRSTGWS